MGNLRDKNDRAIRAFIYDTVKGVNSNLPIYISRDPESRDVATAPGLVDVKTVQGPESPPGSGNYFLTVMVQAKMPGTDQPDQSANTNHGFLNDLIDALHDVLHQSDNGQDYHATAKLISEAGNLLITDQSSGTDEAETARATADADMANYSCLAVIHTSIGGDHQPDEGSNYIELITFQVNVIGSGGYWD